MYKKRKKKKMDEERITNPNIENGQEENLEKSLRPQNLDEYIGQTKVKENMKIYIEAAKKRNEPLDHCLLYRTTWPWKNYPIKHNLKRNEIQHKNHLRTSNRKARRPSSNTHRVVRI